MLTYKVEHYEHGYTVAYYEIHVLFNGVTVGCIYYLEDSLRGATPSVNFDEWRKYGNYQIPTIDPLKIAQEVILEHYLL